MNKQGNLRGKTALVTGSSRGIGKMIAHALAHRGANVTLHGRQESGPLRTVASELASVGDGSVQIACCNFSDTENLESFCEQVWQQSGGLDILVNNAGADVLTGEGTNLNFMEKLELLWKVDVRATLMLSRIVGKRMQSAAVGTDHTGQKSIINIGWDQAQQGMAGDAGEMFATTKGAIASMTRSLAQSLAPRVRVNCVAPGWIQTQWGLQASTDWSDRARSESLMNRWGTPHDVAQTVAFLAGNESSFISGQIICVNGGFKYFQGEDKA
jgi:3-oxoacyl-[acyl-carrier protein] reductase